MPVSPGASGMQPRDPCRPWRGTLASGHKPRGGLLALQSLESNAQLSFATRMEDWTCLGQHKRQPEFPVVTRESRRNSRKTTWLPRHRKMKPFPATAPQEKSHFRNWSSKRYLSPLMRPTKCPDIPVSLERNTEVFRQHFLGASSTLLISTGGSTPLLCLEAVPDLPVAPQDEAGLTTTFQTWPRDRKSTRLNSSHHSISYAVFCLKKKKNTTSQQPTHFEIPRIKEYQNTTDQT